MADTPGIALLPANDHDLLIVLHTKLDRALTDIEKIGDGMSARLVELEHTKAEKKELVEAQIAADKIHDDHERRIRRLEKYVWLAIGALAIIQIILKTTS